MYLLDIRKIGIVGVKLYRLVSYDNPKESIKRKLFVIQLNNIVLTQHMHELDSVYDFARFR